VIINNNNFLKNNFIYVICLDIQLARFEFDVKECKMRRTISIRYYNIMEINSQILETTNRMFG